jgi:hypothetical protein
VQTKYFKKAEEDFYSLLVNNMHPVWSADKSYGAKQSFDPMTEVVVTFPEQKALVDSSQVQKDSLELMNAGLISKEKALSQIYPDASSEEIAEMLVDAGEDKPEVEVTQEMGEDGKPIEQTKGEDPMAKQQGFDIASTALNGAQSQTMLEIVQAAANGFIPRESAKAMIMASFPFITDAQASAVMSSIGAGFKPKEEVKQVYSNERK